MRERSQAESGLEFQGEEVETLTRLGLTLCQARVYLTLVQSGMSTTKTISKISKVTQQDVYRIMPTLQKLGLVEAAVTKPVMFRAILLQEGLSILMERRIKETSELQVKTRKLLQNFRENYPEETLQEEKPQFVLIPEKEAQILRSKEAIRTSRMRVGIITSWRKFLQIMSICNKECQKAMENGAKIRFITQIPEDEEPVPEIVQALKKNPSFEIRHTLAAPEAHVTLFDKREVFINTSVKDDLLVSPFLQSNNPYLVAIVHDYFEMMWLTALEEEPEDPPHTVTSE